MTRSVGVREAKTQRMAADPRTTHARATVAIVGGALVTLVMLTYLVGSNVPYHLAVFQESPVVAVLFPVVFLVFVLAVSLAPRWTQWPLTNRASLWFSEISYSAFLYHIPLIFFAVTTLGVSLDHDPLSLAVVVLPLCLALSALPTFSWSVRHAATDGDSRSASPATGDKSPRMRRSRAQRRSAWWFQGI